MSHPRPDEFVPPPECPVFEPSWEEFADPYAFINKIRPIAEKTGICKVRPPPDWQPPFACDVDKLHFTPRIQRLNELEAQTRVKLNFLDKIAKFWELQGCTLKIPHVERKLLDLYLLFRLVAEEGGFETVCRERRWTKIAVKMGFAPGKAIGSHLRSHYERILYPYSLFQSGANLLVPDLASKMMHSVAAADPDKVAALPGDISDAEYKPHDLAQRQAALSAESGVPTRRGKRMRLENMGICNFTARSSEQKPIASCVKTEPDEPCENRPNLRRRMGSYVAKAEPSPSSPAAASLGKQVPMWLKQEPSETKESVDETETTSQDTKQPPLDSAVDLYVCLVCGSGSDEDRLLLCDGCDDSYHTFCLAPPLPDVPKGDWRCPKCLVQECSKPLEAFGFQQAYGDYSLRAFGEMADSFKSDYFNMPVHMVPTELVEKEFWRLVSTIEEDVTVEYGADIASKEFGSGFPIRNGRLKVSPKDEYYLNSGWNLNNLALMDPSVLTHVTADICGMTLPWLYVGMCFSSFCWHIEDHWSYSINYLHWGEPKTWYGAPGSAAEKLEDVMKELAPELFESQPDLLHQLVTIMNPNTLTAHGVPIYRTNQCAGEFVITFPRSYHSGFNQGFNFAEAVNFCTVDWMPLGRQVVAHYRLLHRYCVFSHDEMVCRMASKADVLDVVLASAVGKDMADMIQEECHLRDKVHKMGVVHCERAHYDLLQDDERQCIKCRTTCYLSAIMCPCSPGVLVCLHHAQELCSCSPAGYTLNYKFTLDELYPMLKALKQRAESFDNWASHVTELLEAKMDQKQSLVAFRSLIEESEAKAFPENDLLRHLRQVTEDAERCASAAQQLLRGRRHTRHHSGGAKAQTKLTVDELKSFIQQVCSLPCSISQTALLKDILERVEDFQRCSQETLAKEVPSVSEIQELLDAGAELDLALPELPPLWGQLERVRWLEAERSARSQPASLTLDAMRQLIDRGVALAPHPSVEKATARLQGLLSVSELWEHKARKLITARPRHRLETLSAAAQETEGIPACLPQCVLLRDAVASATDWLREAEIMQLESHIPAFGALADIVSRGQLIPVKLDPLPQLESLLLEAEAWKKRAAEAFLSKSTPYSLLEVLCPMCEIEGGAAKRKGKKGLQHARKKGSAAGHDLLNDVERALTKSQDSGPALEALEEMRLRELEAVSLLRSANEARLQPGAEHVDPRVCVCLRGPVGAMLQCDLCRGLFHSGCVPEPQGADPPWLCPPCRRSERPPLEEALSILDSLQQLRVSLPEGHALNFAVCRTLSWQRHVQQVLAPCGGGATPTEHRPWDSASPSLDASGEQVVPGSGTPTCLIQENQPDQPLAVFHIARHCTPLHAVSPELEELVLEGLLLPVMVPEVQQLHCMLGNVLATQQVEKSTPCLNLGAPGECVSQGKSSPRPEEGISVSLREATDRVERKAKRRGPRAELRDRAKKAKRNEGKSPEDDLGFSSSSPLSEDQEEDWSVCPANGCLQPEGEEVNWVQCDGRCNQWFHQVCVGITAELAAKEDYVCVSCAVRDGRMAH
ncbi:lysine-specific demethylase 5B-B-like isoform X3 [Scleropages formosus]|uniref:lysine-specific demethylase 5B-B-like isoform X3 n=1 Tax=Scleropages formosus TaxID=113540 RepID=UPI0010FAA113|nr:lysine-specific demethylase 5B-B-like isoform X3 [Scleropages formosus]